MIKHINLYATKLCCYTPAQHIHTLPTAHPHDVLRSQVTIICYTETLPDPGPPGCLSTKSTNLRLRPLPVLMGLFRATKQCPAVYQCVMH